MSEALAAQLAAAGLAVLLAMFGLVAELVRRWTSKLRSDVVQNTKVTVANTRVAAENQDQLSSLNQALQEVVNVHQRLASVELDLAWKNKILRIMRESSECSACLARTIAEIDRRKTQRLEYVSGDLEDRRQ